MSNILCGCVNFKSVKTCKETYLVKIHILPSASNYHIVVVVNKHLRLLHSFTPTLWISLANQNVLILLQ